jgi:hypothetical protein
LNKKLVPVRVQGGQVLKLNGRETQMKVSVTKLSFAENDAEAQSVKVTGLDAETWTATPTDAIKVSPSSGKNDDSFLVTIHGMRADSPGTVTVAAPGKDPITIPVSVASDAQRSSSRASAK